MRASVALKDRDLREFERVLEDSGSDIQEAYRYDLAEESLLYISVFSAELESYHIYRLLARYGVEMGGSSKAFQRKFYARALRSSSEYFPDGDVLQELVDLDLLKLDDLWAISASYPNRDLFEWLLHSGANADYRVPVNGIGNFKTVIAMYTEPKSTAEMGCLL